LPLQHERACTEIIAAVDIAKASIDRGEGTELTEQT